jgi:hypothetical protein
MSDAPAMSDALTTISLDEIDAAFVGRWRRGVDGVGECNAGSGAVQVASLDLEDSVQMLVELAPTPSPPPTGGSVVDRLLRAAWSEWNGLAAHVEAARLRGRRVCAVAGGEPREGRTTLVECLAAVLRARGRDVSCTTPQELAAAAASDPRHSHGHSHDKRIVLVDAGIWFPPGPIRRHWLARSVVGSEAAILVRRADRPSAAARHTVLESLGIEVLGEVLTFTDDVPSAAPESAS